MTSTSLTPIAAERTISITDSENALTAEDIPIKPDEGARKFCVGNYEKGEFSSESAIKLPPTKGLGRIDIQEAANNIIETTNKKRKRDSDMLRDFKKTAEYQLCTTLLEMQNRIHKVYERQGKIMEEKMQELMACLERIEKLEEELAEFRNALQLLYHDIN
ncbi:synaptonemal complex central element protein 2-like [Saccostrea cucullata]|uniref:synaptonemal complex central element protein 2-like n=1 Tax=Saccostrea cuccullata TaxID=36930 RepID=UPI002ED1EA57